MTVEAEMEGCCHSPGRLELSEREEVGGSSPRASWGAQPSLHLDFDFWPQSCERMNFSLWSHQLLVIVMAAPGHSCPG